MTHGGNLLQDEFDESRLRALVLHLPFFVVLIDRQRRFVWVNRLDATLKSEDVLGQTFETFIQESSRPLAVESIERAFETREVVYFEALGYNEGRFESWFGTRVVPLPPDQFGNVGALLLSTDVTQRRQAERALRESEERFRMLTEASPDYVVVIDRERRIEYLNREPPAESGLTKAQLLGTRLDDVVREQERARVGELLERVLDSGQPAQFEARPVDRDFVYVSRVLPFPGPNERRRALIVTTDISEQRKAEAQHRLLEAKLMEAQKMESIGQLAGGVAHDFNNMLLVMSLHLRVARDAIARERSHQALAELEQIDAAVKRAADLTRRLLAFARRQPHQPNAIAASELVENALRMLSRLMPASIKLEHRGSAPEAFVLADPSLIEHALMNLCVNARDAIGEQRGTIGIELGVREVSEVQATGLVPPGRYVTLAVSDTGSGIADSALSRIFEPFFTTKPPGQGTGLGLAMVHGIVTQHGGYVTVDTQLGRGSVFTVFLPQVAPPERASQSVPQRAPRSVPARILVAEDEPSVRRLVTTVLRGAGHTVLEAENGAQTLDVLQSAIAPVDLVILDAVMPEMGGKECYERIQALSPGMPAIFSSGYAGDMLPRGFLEERGLRLIAKPYQPETLLEAVDAVLTADRGVRR